MQVDLTKYTPGEGGSLTIYPDGIYKVQILGTERTVSQPTAANPNGFPQIKWSTSIVEPAEFQGKKLTFFTGLTEKTVWRTLNAIYGCGVDLPKVQLDTDGALFDRILGTCQHLTLGVELIETSYQGKPKNDIQNFLRDPDQDPVSVEADDLPAFLREPGQDDDEVPAKHIEAAQKAGLIKKGSSILKPQPPRKR